MLKPIKPIRYTVEVQFNTRWVALSGGLTLDEARNRAEQWSVPTRITASLSDGRKVVLP